MAERTLETIERPILEAVRAAEIESRDFEPSGLGLDPSVYVTAARSLIEDGFIDGRVTVSGSGIVVSLMVDRLSGKGRRAIQQWPGDDAFEELVAIIRDRIAREDDPGLKRKLQHLLDSLQDVNKVVAAGMIVQLLASATHLR